MQRHAQSGFTLLEALIAVLVLSIGLLGVAAMQLRALQSAHMGYQRAVVSLAAIDAQERAWAGLASNGACPAAGDIQGGWLGQWFGTGRVLTNDASNVGSGASDCEYIVSISWQEDRYSDGESGDAFVYQFRLPEL
ncbi:type IV pilus modification protein PilV [Halomonas sp. MCCC 1A11062]|uniref:type IV pilus modification protein PilV n=1 Tax=Halomonas sp. MCCC 1A11062 TaxID=2733485 RepID=UPI0023EEAAAD|nr:type IV pilus modification protein PilV [Halomonas sp. MCCC 1A11062]MCE8039018.1 type IV pilus modification protein PilV [Halomonas sp. MCCC 1A11062]